MLPFEPLHQHFVGFFQTHLDPPTAVGESVVAHGTEEAVEAGNAELRLLISHGIHGTICTFTYMEWLICYGQLQDSRKVYQSHRSYMGLRNGLFHDREDING